MAQSLYKLVAGMTIVQRLSDGAFIPDDPLNADRMEYVRWRSDPRNLPLPADPLPADTKRITVEGIAELLKSKGVINDDDIESVKRNK